MPGASGRNCIWYRRLLALWALGFLALAQSANALELIKTIQIPNYGQNISTGVDYRGVATGKLMIGYPFYTGAAENSGMAIVVDLLTGDTLAEFYGSYKDKHFGTTVDFVPDFDGDSVVDYLIGSPGYTFSEGATYTGRAMVLSGATGDTLLRVGSLAPQQGIGATTAYAGDLNGDGLSDVVIDVPGGETCEAPGFLLAYAGSSSRRDELDILGYWDHANSASCGNRRARRAGDLNADGFADVLFGRARHYSYFAGIVYGAAEKYLPIDSTDLSYFDSGFDGVGDVNKDGYTDMIFCDIYTANSRGHARVLSGANLDTLYYYEGDIAYRLYGHAALGCGDFDGDSYPDFVVSNIYYGNSVEPFLDSSGAVYVYSGRDGHLIDSVLGVDYGNDLGYALEAVGDVNGDGLADILVASDAGWHIFGASRCCALPGDADGGGEMNIADVTYLVSWMFSGGPAPACCEEGDADQNGRINIADLTTLIAHLFSAADPPACGPAQMQCVDQT